MTMDTCIQLRNHLEKDESIVWRFRDSLDKLDLVDPIFVDGVAIRNSNGQLRILHLDGNGNIFVTVHE